jgi:hypothetical protein
MRVFDSEGLVEAIDEVMNGFVQRDEVKQENNIDATMSVLRDEQTKGPPPPVRKVVYDSEDEDDEDDMLFDSDAIGPAPSESSLTPVEERHKAILSKEALVSFVLIDSIAHVIKPMLKNDYVQANSLLSTTLRTVSNLTHTYNLTSILLNPSLPARTEASTLSSSTPHTASHPRIPTPPHPPQNHPNVPTVMPSIFSSTTTIPMLGTTFLRALDVHLLISRLPRKRKDVRGFYAGRRDTVEGLSVVELVEDRSSGAVGGWGSFGLGVDGEEWIMEAS